MFDLEIPEDEIDIPDDWLDMTSELDSWSRLEKFLIKQLGLEEDENI